MDHFIFYDNNNAQSNKFIKSIMNPNACRLLPSAL